MKHRLTPNLQYYFLFLTLFSFFSFPLSAQDRLPSPPPSRDDVFKGLQLDIEKERAKEKELALQEKNDSELMKKLEADIIPIAQKIQSSERRLIELDSSIKTNEIKQRELEKLLHDNQKVLSDSLMAAIRLKRIPANTLFLQTASPLQTAQTAMILKRAVPSISSRMGFLSNAAIKLTNIEKQLKEQKSEQQEQLATLKSKQIEIESLIKERQHLLKKTQKNILLTQQRTETLSKEASNLKELMKKVQAQNEKFEAEAAAAARLAAKKAALEASIKPDVIKPQKAAFSPSRPLPVQKGNASWPVAGVVKVSYGSPDTYGAKSQGIKIESRPKALVTTPMSGRVRFAGPFKNYDKIVIIEHEGGWHSLIGGLSELNVLVGQDLKGGEPIGRMTSQNNAQGLLLYYELRYKGNPVNPSQKINGLG